ncbi:MAG: class I tRNA ligase family protein, partial [Micrococcales bacterium]|nr:class I tRNA ligase family protein [Micrococcales bacterium]
RLDPLLWRAQRAGEPFWDGRTLGKGRPGWHIECAVIANGELGPRVDVLGGGSDLAFPHHEMSTSHARGITGHDQPVGLTMHQGMLAYGGQKMSKSQGNLVFVHEMLARGINPSAIRLALMSHHYRDDWEWTGQELVHAETRLARWREVVLSARPQGTSVATIAEIRRALADDLDTPAALRAIDYWVRTASSDPEQHAFAGADLRRAIDALLGVQLY